MNTKNKYEIAVFEDNDDADLIKYSESMKDSIEKALDNNKGEQGIQGDKGDRGEKGDKGEDGITPQMLVNGDGHLIAIYN